MGAHMKTTIEISDPLFAKAKALAQKENTTLRSLVEQGLQQVIRERSSNQKKAPFKLRDGSVDGGQLTPEAIARGGWAAMREMANDRDFY
jgi:Bacterial antitoxin of type II TA system, VapB